MRDELKRQWQHKKVWFLFLLCQGTVLGVMALATHYTADRYHPVLVIGFAGIVTLISVHRFLYIAPYGQELQLPRWLVSRRGKIVKWTIYVTAFLMVLRYLTVMF